MRAQALEQTKERGIASIIGELALGLGGKIHKTHLRNCYKCTTHVCMLINHAKHFQIKQDIYIYIFKNHIEKI